MKLQKQLHELRKQKGVNQQDVADYLNISRPAYTNYETGKRNPDYATLQRLADYFGVSTDYILGRGDSFDIPASTGGAWIPVLGRVAAGIPIEAVEDIVDYEEISMDMASSGDCFALKISGDSMEPRIKDGDVVIVRKQDDVESGDIAIVIVNGNDATCKKFVKHESGLSLVSSNPAYLPMFYTKSSRRN